MSYKVILLYNSKRHHDREKFNRDPTHAFALIALLDMNIAG